MKTFWVVIIQHICRLTVSIHFRPVSSIVKPFHLWSIYLLQITCCTNSVSASYKEYQWKNLWAAGCYNIKKSLLLSTGSTFHTANTYYFVNTFCEMFGVCSLQIIVTCKWRHQYFSRGRRVQTTDEKYTNNLQTTDQIFTHKNQPHFEMVFAILVKTCTRMKSTSMLCICFFF